MAHKWLMSSPFPSIEMTFDGDISQFLPDIQNISAQISYHQSKRVWQFPRGRFVEYGPEDESWCRFFGIGEEVEVVQRVVLENMYLVGHSGGRIEFRAIPRVCEVAFTA